MSGSSVDDAASSDDRDTNGLEFPVSHGFVSHSNCSPAAATSVVISSLPSPSFSFRCISYSDSVESRPASSESSAAAAVNDDVGRVVELSPGASSRSLLS